MNACIACDVQGPETDDNVSKEKGGADGRDPGANDSSHTWHESFTDLHPPEVPVGVRSKKPLTKSWYNVWTFALHVAPHKRTKSH